MNNINTHIKTNHYSRNKTETPHSKAELLSQTTCKMFSDVIGKIAAGFTIGTSLDFLSKQHLLKVPRCPNGKLNFVYLRKIVMDNHRSYVGFMLPTDHVLPGTNTDPSGNFTASITTFNEILNSGGYFQAHAITQLFLEYFVWDRVIVPISENIYGPRKEWENKKTTKAIKILSFSAIHSFIDSILRSTPRQTVTPIERFPFNVFIYTLSEYFESSSAGIATTAGAYLGTRAIGEIFGTNIWDMMEKKGDIFTDGC